LLMEPAPPPSLLLLSFLPRPSRRAMKSMV
jgi:hypothetical protein